METKWTKIIEYLPQPNQEYLVWTGHHFIVSNAEYYDESFFEHIPQELHEQFRKLKGYFEEFGAKYYFDDEKVQYTELPKPPKGR